MRELLVIVPSRSRPHNVLPVVEAWLDTGAFADAELLFAIDADDPAYGAYSEALQTAAGLLVEAGHGGLLRVHSIPRHEQLVPKLNGVAAVHVQFYPERYALGFAGDDHRPRTPGWARRHLDALRELGGTGIVYPDDGYQGETIPTSWVMSSDIVRALGAMVPAEVEHLFCDNAIRDLGEAADCLRYLPAVLVEHLHPVAGKADDDDQYRRVNHRRQWRADKAAYRGWRERDLARQAGVIRALRTGEAS